VIAVTATAEPEPLMVTVPALIVSVLLRGLTPVRVTVLFVFFVTGIAPVIIPLIVPLSSVYEVAAVNAAELVIIPPMRVTVPIVSAFAPLLNVPPRTVRGVAANVVVLA
jgi:hypothetical protein